MNEMDNAQIKMLSLKYKQEGLNSKDAKVLLDLLLKQKEAADSYVKHLMAFL